MATKRFPFSPFPSGWFCVGFSDELRVGEIQSRKLFGHDTVVFRTARGKAAMLEAHCPHMGAHLGKGGTLEGESLRCPMHGFCFDRKGDCVSTPYGTKVPPAARARSWPLEEKHGVLLAYHDARGREPEWSVPELDMTGWTALRSQTYRLRSHPQETSENSVDIGHFEAVHRYSQPTLLDGPRTEGPSLFMRYSFKRSPGALRLFVRELEVEFEARVHGLGYSLVCAEIKALGIQTRQLVLATPTDGEHIELRIALSVGPPTRDAPFAIRNLPWPIVANTFSVLGMREYANDVGQDFAIWENKTYLERPVLAKGDGPIPQYRKWCRQFYSEESLPIAAE
ncbi:MAG: Rieske 2Fe-2S domain-containing protein [Sandaracinaceae bacterium]|nr:Rieske 2Fe-2S domain-containing protein [Sandaracinaceae bacterium]